MKWQRLAAVTACASLVGVAACGGGDGAEGTDSSIAAGGDVARADSPATATTPGAATTPAGGSGVLAITGGDAEVLQVLAVVDQAEIEDGRLAQRQARNAQVKAFARELVTSHQRSLQKGRQLAKTQNVELMTLDSGATGTARASGTDTNRSPAGTPAAGTPGSSNPMGGPNSVAGQLHTMHRNMMQQLQTAQGAAFDSAFVNAQVMTHQQVLDLLQRAQGQPQNADVQQHLGTAVKEVQEHLDRARELQQSLASGGTGTAGDTGSKSKTGADTARRGG